MTASKVSPGKKFCLAVENHHPLQIVGTINAYCAMMAKNTGHQAIYLSGGGIANASYGLPDLGITTLNDVLVDVERVTNACDLPLLVDIDTGFGGAFNIARTVKSIEKAGAAAVHMEDQVAQKRCGHRPNKAIVSTQEMTDRIKAAVDAKSDSDFVLMARTDALAVEGMESAIERCIAYVESGADMLFPEAFVELNQYQRLSDALTHHFGYKVPILANITEFGQTPLYKGEELAEHSVDMVLYPLSAFRAMNKAAEMVYSHLLHEGNQEALVDQMQTRKELYQHLNYHDYEDKLDELFADKT
ncbi:methylisocitrate lyase [Vibrio penaeicida]|uniref:2-methylisocitrate lyase n=1 Tax=Vibrio penaeicida TaxID=104609 RepID=A0AAV5NW91_9VIBR|nr:methylisocitrate lyase [Vibrio penaeicida]RTZ21956.1 methylisocitrate lyase [Vibrio penaeicida]GLQ74845.1 2-methylisocitrate lyase [Vibrio penaeicida]